jgi:uncharacterized membrane protein YkvA (DUF1232 family)
MMAEDPNRKVIKAEGGFFEDIWVSMRLVVRLLADNRVNPFLKLLPIGTLVYLVFPLDFPGPIDDAAVIALGMYLFIELSPQDVVEEHRQILRGITPGTAGFQEPQHSEYQESDVIEAEFREE